MISAAHIYSGTPIYDNQATTSAKSNWLKVLIGSSLKPHETGYLAPSFAVVFNNLAASSSWYIPNSDGLIITATRQELAIMIEWYTVYGTLCPIELGIPYIFLAPNLNLWLLWNMITHLSTRADGARKKFKDLNEQVGEHVDAVAQSYAPIFIFQCLLYVCLLYLYVTTLTTIALHFISFTTSVWHVISFSHSSSFVFTLPLSFPTFIIAVSWLPQFTTFTWLRFLQV